MTFNFADIARRISQALGSSVAFGMAFFVVVVWAATGPFFGFSETWQLIINTGTTIVTFLMVFLVQNTQNRDALALHLKIDELIRSTTEARNKLIDLENCTDEELDELRKELQTFARKGNRAEDAVAGRA